jgi:hypothetical protein
MIVSVAASASSGIIALMPAITVKTIKVRASLEGWPWMDCVMAGTPIAN